MINPYIIIAALLAIAGSGFQGYRMGKDSVIAEQVEQREVQRQTQDAALQAAAQEIAKIEVKNVTIQGKVIERIRTETVYTECKHSPETMSLIKDAFK